MGINDVSTHDFILRSQRQGGKIALAQKNELARAYLADVLGLTKETIEAFLNDVPTAKAAVTLPHMLRQEPPFAQRFDGYKRFSQLVGRLMPGAYTLPQLELLQGEDAPDAAYIMLVALSPQGEVPILDKIRNATYESHKRAT